MTTLKNDVYFAEFKLLFLTAMSICVKSREKKTSIQLAVGSFHARDTSVQSARSVDSSTDRPKRALVQQAYGSVLNKEFYSAWHSKPTRPVIVGTRLSNSNRFARGRHDLNLTRRQTHSVTPFKIVPWAWCVLGCNPCPWHSTTTVRR